MVNLLYLFLISLCLNKLLNIDNIYLKEYQNNKNNFSIIIDIFEDYQIFKKDIFQIILKSENIKEQEQNIIFLCSIFGKSVLYNPHLECSLKEVIPNLKGPFYLKKEHFQKSFQIKENEKYISYILEINEKIFYRGIINNEITKINKNNYILYFNYKSCDFKIPIAMALDNNYIYLTIIAIHSIMLNSYPETFYIFYIMHSPDFTEINKNKLLNLTNKYNRCSIQLIDMKNEYKDEAILQDRITTPTYYRISLPYLLPQYDKLIYLDGDIICYGDLKEMYYIDMENYYYKGFLYYSNDPSCANNDIYIGAGVLLVNNKELRKDDMVNKMIAYMKNNRNTLKLLDQTIINYVCKDKIGFLPAKYGRLNFLDLIERNESVYDNKKYKYTREELEESYINPIIYHFIFKPWVVMDKYQAFLFWDFVKKIGIYEEVCSFYNVCEQLKQK